MTVYKICFDGNYCVFKNLEDAWENNDWVWVYEFERMIDNHEP